MTDGVSAEASIESRGCNSKHQEYGIWLEVRLIKQDLSLRLMVFSHYGVSHTFKLAKETGRLWISCEKQIHLRDDLADAPKSLLK